MEWTFGSDDVRARWGLDPSVTFLNHGSFGATPRVVREAQRRWMDELEREPVLFLARKVPGLLAEVRARVAAFVGAEPGGIALVPNATTGVNAVLRSLDFGPGDEILCADQSYNAVLQTVRAITHRTGAVLTQARFPFPIGGPDEIVDAFAAAITPRTRLLLVDHITSPTAMILPVAALVVLARERGLPILVDGAHAPGMLPLQLDALGADFYTGNLHKWAFAPKGAALLHVAPAWRGKIHPVTTSHWYGGDWQAEFDWTGTFDPSAWLSIPDGLDYWATLPGLPERAHDVAVRAQRLLLDTLGERSPYPEAMFPSMAIVPWAPGGSGPALTARLFEEHRIEVPFTSFDSRIWLRISVQAYNRWEDYERLAAVLRDGWR